MSASYDNKGTWLESETEITAKDLPSTVTNTLAKEFEGYKTGEISAIENPRMKGFELALKKAGNPDPRTCVLLDDQRRITRAARLVGLYTILVGQDSPGEDADATLLHLADLPSLFDGDI